MRLLAENPCLGAIGLLMVMMVNVTTPAAAAPPPAAIEAAVLIVTQAPYESVDPLVEALATQGFALDVVTLRGGYHTALRQLQGRPAPGPKTTVITFGGAALPSREWLSGLNPSQRPAHWISVGPPTGGSVTAELLFLQDLLHRVDTHRRQQNMSRRVSRAEWQPGTRSELVPYLADRTQNLYEGLYHRFLIGERMSWEAGTQRFLEWLGQEHTRSLRSLFSDGTVGPGEGQLTRGYVEYMAAHLARNTYYSQAPVVEVLTQDLLADLPLERDLRAAALQFAVRRALRFVKDYAAPQLIARGREEALGWLEAQHGLDAQGLKYQLPQSVSVAWGDGHLHIPGNRLLDPLSRKPLGDAQVTTLVVEAPNWWQLLRTEVGPNDWWTETRTARWGASGRVEELFLPVGGALGQSDAIIERLLHYLGVPLKETSSGGWQNVLGMVADRALGLLRRVRGGTGISQSAAELESPELSRIHATYRNKSTTLRDEHRVYHDHWLWRLNGELLPREYWPDVGVEGSLTLPAGATGQLEAESVANDGRVLHRQQWELEEESTSDDGSSAIHYGSAREVIPTLRLKGPKVWVTGRPAHYSIEMDVAVPEEVEDFQVYYYPDEAFEVFWERPGRFHVKGAVNLRYSWRFPDGSRQYFSVTFTEEMPVEVLATSLQP